MKERERETETEGERRRRGRGRVSFKGAEREDGVQRREEFCEEMCEVVGVLRKGSSEERWGSQWGLAQGAGGAHAGLSGAGHHRRGPSAGRVRPHRD